MAEEKKKTKKVTPKKAATTKKATTTKKVAAKKPVAKTATKKATTTKKVTAKKPAAKTAVKKTTSTVKKTAATATKKVVATTVNKTIKNNIQVKKSEAKGLNIQRIIILFLLGVGIIGSYLPWVTTVEQTSLSSAGQSVNGFDIGDGIITVGLFIIILVAALVDKRAYPLSGTFKWITFAATLIVTLFTIIELIYMNSYVNEFSGVFALSFGLPVILISAVAILVLSLIGKQFNKKA